MATETPFSHRDQANAYLLSHRLSQDAALKEFVKPLGVMPDDGWLDRLLEDARKNAKTRQRGAWGTIAWLLRSHCLFGIEDKGFHTAREAVPNASPEVLARWLSQWNRPELWLAALGFDYPVDKFPALLSAVLHDKKTIASELLAVVVKCALQAAYNHLGRERRASLGTIDSAPYWARHGWPDIADSLVKNLVAIPNPASETLITDMLCDYRHATASNDHSVIDEEWHLRLATHAPKGVFSELLSRSLNSHGEVALETAALITQLQLESRSERARQVFHTYLRMPWETWRWKSSHGRLPGFLANCLKEFNDPLECWIQAWKVCNPGAPEGWPADLNGRSDKHAAAVHLEIVGILASLNNSIGKDGQPGISDSVLLNAVGHAIHDRLASAVGHYEESDGHVLQVYWSIMGGEEVISSCQKLNDIWVYERRWEMKPGLVRFSPLLS